MTYIQELAKYVDNFFAKHPNGNQFGFHARVISYPSREFILVRDKWGNVRTEFHFGESKARFAAQLRELAEKKPIKLVE